MTESPHSVYSALTPYQAQVAQISMQISKGLAEAVFEPIGQGYGVLLVSPHPWPGPRIPSDIVLLPVKPGERE